MSRLSLLLPAVFASACASAHLAEHSGFHLQGTVGPAVVSEEGAGVTGSVAAGVAIAPNLILGVHAWDTAVTALVNDAEIYGIGPTAEYYFMPANVYLAATPAFTRMSTSMLDGFHKKSQWGPGLRAAVGKEWFVSRRCGLGIAGLLDVSSSRFGDGERSTRVTGAVLFSASLN
jgi:hypothetical protein